MAQCPAAHTSGFTICYMAGLKYPHLLSNWGTLILDATCVPDDIPYPVDLRLLAESRETTEKVIDELFKQLQGIIPRKPRCNSIKAHNLFLAIIKKKPDQQQSSSRLDAAAPTA